MSARLLTFIFTYEAIVLGRCAMLSLPLLLIVMLLRRTVLKRNVFAKGAAWSVFLLVPFLGKFRFYYEPLVAGDFPLLIKNPFALWHVLCTDHPWLGWAYAAGVLGSLFLLLRRHFKVRHMLRRMGTATVCGQGVFLSDIPMSPFTTGLIRPRIVVPRVAVETLSEDELRTILLHERTHIRLGHLWIFALWELLSALLWVDPLLFFALRSLNEDMEQICDRVTIQKSKRDATGYGRLILKSVTLLQTDVIANPAAFSGERSFSALRERFVKVRDFAPYHARRVTFSCALGVGVLFGLLGGILHLSYPQYTEFTDVIITDETGNYLLTSDLSELSGALEMEGNVLTVQDSRTLRALLSAELPKDSYYYFYCGGFYKLPGIGGGTGCWWVEDLPESGEVAAVYGEPDLSTKTVELFIKLL